MFYLGAPERTKSDFKNLHNFYLMHFIEKQLLVSCWRLRQGVGAGLPSEFGVSAPSGLAGRARVWGGKTAKNGVLLGGYTGCQKMAKNGVFGPKKGKK
jgi:hypothetical protein